MMAQDYDSNRDIKSTVGGQTQVQYFQLSPVTHCPITHKTSTLGGTYRGRLLRRDPNLAQVCTEATLGHADYQQADQSKPP